MTQCFQKSKIFGTSCPLADPQFSHLKIERKGAAYGKYVTRNQATLEQRQSYNSHGQFGEKSEQSLWQAPESALCVRDTARNLMKNRQKFERSVFIV